MTSAKTKELLLRKIKIVNNKIIFDRIFFIMSFI